MSKVLKRDTPVFRVVGFQTFDFALYWIVAQSESTTSHNTTRSKSFPGRPAWMSKRSKCTSYFCFSLNQWEVSIVAGILVSCLSRSLPREWRYPRHSVADVILQFFR